MDVKNKILVTGGTGMIGKYVVKNLLNKGYKVVILTRNKRKNDKNVEYFQGDITERKSLSGLMKGISGIIHLAACLNLSLPLEQFYKVNVEGTKNILDLALKNKVKLVVNTSSMVVFGGCGDNIKNEKTVLRNSNLDKYTETKIKSLLLAKKYREKGLNIINVYPTAVIDINKKSELNNRRLIKLIWKITGGIPGGLVGLFGPGKRWINYVLVEDVADGIVLAMEKGKKNSDYILGGENIMIKDYLRKMVKIYKSWYLPFRIPSSIAKIILGMNFEDSKFSIEKAKKEIDYFPKNTIN